MAPVANAASAASAGGGTAGVGGGGASAGDGLGTGGVSGMPLGRAVSTLTPYLIVAAFVGQCTVCRYGIVDANARRQPSLQSALLQTAALQAQAVALPVAAHAIGLASRPFAAACTVLPLCGPIEAAVFCAAFLAANAVVVVALLPPRLGLWRWGG